MTIESQEFTTRAAAFEASEDTPTNEFVAETFGDVVQTRYLSRRGVLKGMTAVAAITAIATPLETLVSRAAHAASAPFRFTEIEHGVDETHHVAPG